MVNQYICYPSKKWQTYQTNNTTGAAQRNVVNENVLHSRTKNAISANTIRPIVQKIKYPMPSHEWYFSVVNSVSKVNEEEFSNPVAK